MKNASTLEEVFASIAEQTIADAERRSLEKPTPWFTLLHYPSRAAWRSTDHILGTNEDDDADAENGKRGKRRTSLLAQTQFNLLQHSQRTNKQLKRTYKRIMDTHKSLAIGRERERRLAANYLSPAYAATLGGRRGGQRNGIDGGRGAMGGSEADGSIEDGRGRLVGDWRDKNKVAPSPPTSTISMCDDPSVALSLSMGLYSSTNAYYHSNKRGNNQQQRNAVAYFGDKKLNMNHDDDNEDEDTSASMMQSAMNVKSAESIHKLAKSKDIITSNNDMKPVGYGPEQTMTHVKFRLGPNYSIVKRVLLEVQSLLGGKGGGDTSLSSSSSSSIKSGGYGARRSDTFRPRRILDFGSGVGSASAAALDVFGVSRRMNNNDGDNGIDWIHSIDASQSMRESTEKVLKSILEGMPWEEDEKHADLHDDDIEEMQLLETAESEKDSRRLERRRKRMEKWEQTWNKRTDARTRLTFGESITDTSFLSASMQSHRLHEDGDENADERSRLPWQQQLDEQRKKVTMGKKLQSSSSMEGQRSSGSFDLILCSYTLSELPSVPASLAAAALLWEKLAPDGVLVFVEPGTPDGFGMLRSVRSMLLECCPPPEKRRSWMQSSSSGGGGAMVMDNEESGSDNDDNWSEECHVIAPCTHNGTCPMARHQTNHVKRNSRFAKYEAAEPIDDEDGYSKERREDRGTENDEDEDEKEGTFQELLDEWDNMSKADKEELKLMLGDGRDLSDEEMKAMLEYMDSIDDGQYDDDEGEEEDDDEDDDDSDEEEEFFKDQDAYREDDGDAAGGPEYYNINNEGSPNSKPPNKKISSTLEETGVFGASFCSFVHTFPGGTSRSKGEKFSYLVLQKRNADSNNDDCTSSSSSIDTMIEEHPNSLREMDIVEMLSQSVHHAQKMKKEELRHRLRQKGGATTVNNDDMNHETPRYMYHDDQFHEILQKAVIVEDEFLDSTQDSLGLEMLHGDERRRGWGRLIRAPLKRKGHVLLDYCSAGCTGGTSLNCSKKKYAGNDSSSMDDGTQGRIIRQKVSRGWSARTAPGCYSAARKARWGGLWPDLSERMKQLDAEKKDDETLRDQMST